MRSTNFWPLSWLLLIGLLLAAANLWVTAARSTIPLALDGMIFAREIRHEKFPGYDDVFFIILDGGRRLHVDKPVYLGVEIGDLVEKRRFEKSLIVSHSNGELKKVELTPSADHLGMHRVMPIALGVAIALAGVAWWTFKDLPRTHKDTKENSGPTESGK